MKESFWGYFLIALGVVILIIILMVQRITVTNEEDFYLGREVLEASMYDAVDFGTYESTGKLVMSKEKFVEVFLRRFAESITNNNMEGYQIDFYDIHEYPPKASVRIRTKSGTTEINSDAFNVNLDTLLNGVLVTNYGKHKLGDVDMNGKLETHDYELIMEYINDGSIYRTNNTIGKYYSAAEKRLADINNDGKIDIDDYKILKDFIDYKGQRDNGTGLMVGKDLYDYEY